MKYDKIKSELFTLNRRNFTKKLKKNSIAVFHSNDIMPTNADGSMKFKQNSNLFYLDSYQVHQRDFFEISLGHY